MQSALEMASDTPVTLKNHNVTLNKAVVLADFGRLSAERSRMLCISQRLTCATNFEPTTLAEPELFSQGAHMRNITVTIEDKTYREIRAWCARRDTCVSHVVQAFLNDLNQMQEVHCFPLPGAPDPQSLGARFNQLHSEEAEEIRRYLEERIETR